MKAARKTAVVVAALAGFGVLRLPLEDRLTRDLEAQQLLPQRLELATRERLDQTGALVALGGLRTLVAALLNLRAFGFFERRDWFRLEQTYDTIVTLAPRTLFYWDFGAWHLAYNASAHYLEHEDLPPLRRRQLWRDAIGRGIALLERGIRNNPDDWMLPSRLARLYDDPFKLSEYAEAARWFKVAADNGAPPFIRRSYLAAIARIPERREETLALARQLHADPANRVPTLNCIRFSAEARADPSRSPAELVAETFDKPQQAWDQLRLYHDRRDENFPQHGVARALRWLQDQPGIVVPAHERLPPPEE